MLYLKVLWWNIINLAANHIPVNKILRVLHKKRQWKKCPIVNQVVHLYVQMVLLPDLIVLIVFSVKRKVIKKSISSSKLNHKSLIRFLGDYIVKHINQNSYLHEGLSLYLAGLFSRALLLLSFFSKTRNILFTGIWFATRPMIFHHKTFRYNKSNWRHFYY
jgi:hypothetical protein